MNDRTTPPRRHSVDWLEFTADAYLEHRHRNWALAEEMGDVVFFAARGVVAVHRHRGEHIVTTLGPRTDQPIAPAATSSAPVRATARAARTYRPVQTHAATVRSSSRSRDLLGWLGIVSGAAVYIAALAVPLDDAALIVSFAATARGCTKILAADV